jgi:hypothetical protein
MLPVVNNVLVTCNKQYPCGAVAALPSEAPSCASDTAHNYGNIISKSRPQWVAAQPAVVPLLGFG